MIYLLTRQLFILVGDAAYRFDILLLVAPALVAISFLLERTARAPGPASCPPCEACAVLLSIRGREHVRRGQIGSSVESAHDKGAAWRVALRQHEHGAPSACREHNKKEIRPKFKITKNWLFIFGQNLV